MIKVTVWNENLHEKQMPEVAGHRRLSVQKR